MSESEGKKPKISTLESELYLLIAKFLRVGPCKESAKLLVEEIEENQLLPKRIDWLGNEHSRSFNELDSQLSLLTDDHLLKICSRIGPILDKELPSTVPGLTSLLGVGRQSLLRTKEDLQKPKCQLSNLIARKNGMPLLPSNAAQSTYPPNIAQVLVSRETSGAVSCKHTFTPKIYARQQIYRRLLGHLSSVYCVLFDRTGKYIFTGADDLLVKVWNAQDGRLLAALRGHSAEITDMAVNHENTLLAAGSCDKTIRVWCLRTTAPVAVLSGHTGMVTSLQFCPYPKNDDRLLISTGNDGCVCFWHWNPKNNAFNPKPLRFTERNKANAQMICSSFSSGGLFLATGSTDNNVRIYNIAGTNGPEKILEREVHTDRVDSLQFSNHDCRCVSGSKDGTALIWKYESQNWTSIVLKMSTKLPGCQSEEPEDTTKVKLRVTMVGWTLDDDKVITAVSDHSIKVWNSYNGNLCYVLKGHEDEVFVLEPHPTDSRVFLSSGHDGRIIIWDLVTGTVIKNFFNLIEGQGHGAVFDCKFSPDGLMFASTDSHGHLSIFGFGSAERYKKVPEEQFFHTDYRPLIRDIHHHVLDEQTQTAPHLLPPPFLVDIDGNPYPPNVQRLVPGREHHNDSQLVPYVAVSAAGDSEILEPVRPANDNRPTIDDMIERLQQEREQADENEPQRMSFDFRSPQSSRMSVNGERSAADPFSPRTPRSQAGHSRVGLRRTGDVEGVQSVGNWQSRGSNADIPSWVKRVVVKPMRSSMSKYFFQKRVILADKEIKHFNKEKKRRLPERNEECRQESNENNFQRRRGNRAGLRSAPNEEGNQENGNNSSSSSSSETEQCEGMTDSESEYSDWMADKNGRQLKSKSESSPEPQPSTSGLTRRSASSRQIKPRRRLVSSEEEETDDEDETPSDDESTPKKTKRKMPTPAKKKPANGKKLPERWRPPEWLTGVVPFKAPYIPQIGDEVVYFRQGHELYVQAVKRNQVYDISMKNQPWRKTNLRDQEVARIDDITFENHPPRLCCLVLTLLNPVCLEESFTVKYHDMADVIDFIVLKQNYDQAMYYDWKPGDRFRSAIDKAWWLGTIKAQKPLNPNFPDSMFQCFLVKWDNGEKEHMSPWDFEPIDNERLPSKKDGSVPITPEERSGMMYVPEPQEWSNYGRDHDCDRIARGLTRIMELSIADPFIAPVDLNLYPTYAIHVAYPMDLSTIKSRVENRFYRRIEAVKFDVQYITLNAQKFNEPGSRIVKQAKCVVDLCIKFIEAHYCSDPMTIYNEMMEAKQSRSQDSQSELDVLCSEMESDGENNSRRIKRKKQTALQNSSKRVRLENQKYTSSSWQQQCSALLDTFYQCEDSTPFRQPVSLADYPDYRNIIDIPMDLSKVRERINTQFYYSPIEFCKDMRLIFQNSRNYNTNKKSRIYSMTIRLSAMFEEHIRSIVSDWRSAVKYEEKIRNNQFVSSRRKPIPVQESDLNVGASTSRSSNTQSSSRSEGSRNSGGRSSSSLFFESSSSHIRLGRASNGTNLKKLKNQDPQSSKKSSFNFKRKKTKLAAGPLTNGVNKRVSKRKYTVRSPKKLSERPKPKHSYNEDISHSDTQTSNHSSSEADNNSDEWNKKPKRRRKDNSAPAKKGRPVQSARTRPIRTAVTSRFSHWGRRRSQSSSPENGNLPTKSRTLVNKFSPLQTRSKRLRPIRKPKYHEDYVTEESSANEGQEQVSSETQYSKSLPTTSSSTASQDYSDKKESNSTSDQSEEEEQTSFKNKAGIRTRNSVRTRNRGKSTVKYGEESENEGKDNVNSRGQRSVCYKEDSDNEEPSTQKAYGRGRRPARCKEDSENEESSRGVSGRVRKVLRQKEEFENVEESSQGKSSRVRRNLRYKEESENEDESSQGMSSRVRRTARYKEHSENEESSQGLSSRVRRTARYKEHSENEESSQGLNSRVRRTARYKEHSENEESSQGLSSRVRKPAQYKEESENEDSSQDVNTSKVRSSARYKYGSDNEESSQGIGDKRLRRTARYKEESENEELPLKPNSRVRRPVRYKEDSENEESMQAINSRSLRSQANGDEQHLGIPKKNAENEGCPTPVLKLGRQGSHSGKRSLFHLSTIPQRTRSSEKHAKVNKVLKVYKLPNSSPGLRKCSKLIKRSVFKKPYSPLSPIQIKARTGLRTAKAELNRVGPDRKPSGISSSTRSQLELEESPMNVASKPTIIFCKPSTSVSESDTKNRVKLSADHNYDCRSKFSAEISLESLAEKNGSSSNLTMVSISSNTRSSSPRFTAAIGSKNKYTLKQEKQSSKTTSKYIVDSSSTLKQSRTLKSLSIRQIKNRFASPTKVLGINKSKWSLRKPNASLRASQNLKNIEPDKIQTRNRGIRTVVYDEDDNYFNEILENEDPVKTKKQQNSSVSMNRNNQNSLQKVKNNYSQNNENLPGNSKENSVVGLRPKKAFKILSNGIETRNHGQRTTLYAEDGDEYLEQYFDNLDL